MLPRYAYRATQSRTERQSSSLSTSGLNARADAHAHTKAGAQEKEDEPTQAAADEHALQLVELAVLSHHAARSTQNTCWH